MNQRYVRHTREICVIPVNDALARRTVRILRSPDEGHALRLRDDPAAQTAFAAFNVEGRDALHVGPKSSRVENFAFMKLYPCAPLASARITLQSSASVASFPG